jgi:hypothetical protein
MRGAHSALLIAGVSTVLARIWHQEGLKISEAAPESRKF